MALAASRSTKVDAPIDAALIASLKVARTVAVTLTSIAPPAGVIAEIVGAVVSPGAPVDTTKLTVAPAAPEVPAAGFWLIVVPDATVVLDAVVTLPTASCAVAIALRADCSEIPTTFGTVTTGGPVETTKFTAMPAL